MDLNEIENIGNSVKYDRNSVESRRVSRKSVPTGSFTSSNVDALDQIVYGNNGGMIMENQDYDPSTYDPNDDMKRMTQDFSQISRERLANSKVPKAIKESMINNPINVEPYTDPKMDELTEKISSGINRSYGIMNKLEQMDKKKTQVNETATHQSEFPSFPRVPHLSQQSSGVDYELIKNIIESVVDRKLKEYTNTLNESVSRGQGTPMSVMVMRDKFLFLDNENNVFECKMEYKGKNKAKRK